MKHEMAVYLQVEFKAKEHFKLQYQYSNQGHMTNFQKFNE